MSVMVEVTITGVLGNRASRLADSLHKRGSLHAALAQASEKFVKDRGRATASSEHATAQRLGAAPTGHLARAYDAIEGESDDKGARLLVPRASRLRAAFGGFTIRPTGGRKYLTIPANRDAYGKRAGEFSDLVFMRLGPRKTPVLARTVGTNKTLEVMYRLVKQVTQKEDPGLLDFPGILATATDAAEAWIDEIVEGATS